MQAIRRYIIKCRTAHSSTPVAVSGFLKRRAFRTVVCVLAAALAAGCAAPDFTVIRRDQSRRFLERLDNRTALSLPADARLGLGDCIRLGLRHNLELQSARIRQQVAGLERKTAFANFLPRVEAGVSQQWWRHQPGAEIAGMLTPIQDRRVREAALSISQPVFMPYTWYLYSMFQKGEDISTLITLRTRQQIALNITGLYYRCLTLEETGAFLKTAARQSESLLHEVQQRRLCELARAGDVAEAEAEVLARRFAVADNRRQLRQARSELLEAMGLDPLSGLRLKQADPLASPRGKLHDLVLEALLTRPELQIRDRSYEIERDKIKMALTEFLPVLSGFSSLGKTSDSFVHYQTVLTGGLTGVMTLFNGFADINAYRAARDRAREAFVGREQACLMIMLQVQQAFLNVESAGEAQAVADKMLEARETKLQEQTAAWKEGLVQLSDRLEYRVLRDRARMQQASSAYTRQVAVAALCDVLGRDTNMLAGQTAGSGPAASAARSTSTEKEQETQ